MKGQDGVDGVEGLVTWEVNCGQGGGREEGREGEERIVVKRGRA